MNYYENKMLQDREKQLISTGIVFLIFALPIAFILFAFIALPLGLPDYGHSLSSSGLAL
jgi:hypothetical protein